MKIWKNIGSASVLTVLMVSAFSANANDSGTITINGSVTDATCVIKSEHLSQTINMAKITPSDLEAAAPGAVVANETFNFDVENCPATTSAVGVTFTFTGDSSDAQYLANTGDATGVLLGITKADDSRVRSGESIMSTNFVPANGEGTVAGHIKAYRVGTETPEAGDINSVATIALITQ